MSKFVQGKPYALAGSGITSVAVTITLSSFKTPAGVNLTMTDFGTIGYGVLEPKTSKVENFSFTGVTQNADGTATLTGVTRGLKFVSPYDADATLQKAHSGSSVVIISNTVQFYAQFAPLDTANTWTGKQTFTTAQRPALTSDVDSAVLTELVTFGQLSRQVFAGAANASNIVIGITKLSVAPVSAPNPIAVGDNDTRVPTATQAAALVGSGTPSATDPYLNISTIRGIITPYGGFSAPTGWLLCDGGAVSRATYASLFALLNPSLGAVTMTIASPGVFTLTAHGLVLDDLIYLTTTGALPTGLAANTRYYVVSVPDANTFTVSATKGGAAINTTGSQSGVHTLLRSPYGVGDGSTTFNVPNLKGVVPVGRDAAQTEFNSVGETGGEKTHVLTTAEMPAHTHVIPNVNGAAGANSGPLYQANVSTVTNTNTGSTGGDGAHNNLQPYVALNYIIKT